MNDYDEGTKIWSFAYFMSETSPPTQRPLSPHLQVYRLPYNALMSIAGRGVGVVLSLVLIAVLIWFCAVVWKPEMYEQTMLLLEMPCAEYAFLALAFAVFFYLGNGVRHVLWDMGFGVNEKTGIVTGNLVLLLSVLLTLGLWAINNGHAPQIFNVTQEEASDEQ